MTVPTSARRRLSSKSATGPTWSPPLLLPIIALLTFLVVHSSKLPSVDADSNADRNRKFDVFSDTTGNPDGFLQRLVSDSRTGRLYLGATNRVYQLDEQLSTVEAMSVLGPHSDSPSCPPPPTADCHDASSLTLTGAVVKAMAIDRRADRLITCTNLFQGHCDRFLLSNVSVSDPPVWSMVVPNDHRSPAVLLVSPGPPNPASTDVLYVAATRSTIGLPAYRDIVPSLSMRNRHDLALVSDDQLTPSRLDVEVQHRDTFRVRYVAGFSSAGFTYFVAVQRPSATADRAAAQVTRLARVCQNDRSFASYAELPLECRLSAGSSGGIDALRIVRSVAVTHVGSRLARQLGIRSTSASSSDLEHVLVAVFSSSYSTSSGGVGSPVDDDDDLHAGFSSVSVTSKSALCVYTMRDVRKAFTAAIQRCFRGFGNTGPDHLVPPKTCYKTPLEINDEYCGQHGINHPIKGTEPVSRPAVIAWQDTSLTSIAIARTGNYTVAFVGTSDGHVKKVMIESDKLAREFESVSVERGVPIKQDMLLDRSGDYLYAMTDKKLVRVKVHDCSYQYQTCSDCLAARDPYCGWCPLQRRCSTSAQCTLPGTSASSSSSSWLSYDAGRCTRLVMIDPPSVQRRNTDTTTITITVQNLMPSLPPPSSSSASPASTAFSYSSFECLFIGVGVSHSTAVENVQQIDGTNTAITCQTPEFDYLPHFAPGKDYIHTKLTLMNYGYELLSTNFTFYDCNVHTSCSMCSASSYSCVWCIERHACLSDVTSSTVCSSDVIVSASQNRTTGLDSEFCPYIENVVATVTEIPVPSGAEVSVKVRAQNLQSFQTSFKCRFDWNGGLEKHAWLLPGEGHQVFIECDPHVFVKSNGSTFVDIPMSVVWGNKVKKQLDNPHNVQVRLFTCSAMAANCGRCRVVDSVYGCGWCASSRTCTVRSQCNDRTSWVTRDGTCPDPVVIKISPVTGPLEGGTYLTVEGENLGLSSNDTTVTVAGIDCQIIDYQPSATRLICLTGRSTSAVESDVIVSIDNSIAAKSPVAFTYVQPEMTHSSPTRGPMSGGSRLTIYGKNLDSGSHVDFKLTNVTLTIDCTVLVRNSSALVCSTAPATVPFEARMLTLRIDDSVTALLNASFRYVLDPTVTSVTPEKGVFSGGTQIIVTGERLDVASSSHLILYVGNQSFAGSLCNAVTPGRMICPSPSLVRSSLNVTGFSSTAFSYGLSIDGVPTTRNLSRPASGEHMFVVFPDPQFDEFEDGVKKFFFLPNEYLTINGKNINLALQEPDIQVRIGDGSCEVTSVSNTQLTCLPDIHPHRTEYGSSSSSSLRVLVLVGNTTYYVGQLDHSSANTGNGMSTVQRYVLSVPFVSGVAASAGVLLTAIVIVCAAYHRKSRESDRVMKRMQSQMDGLESRVAKECKEAFAELQTDMTEIVSSISGTAGIPFRSYSGFCVRSFFPGVAAEDHAVLGTFQIAGQRNGMERGLIIFNQLVSNKIFLLLFIRTLEQQEDFIVREKVNVASLLSVILQNRLEYLTDILKTLLSELIEKTIEGRYHPKLLLRRTESVVEKMLTNWFTILLFGFLKDCAGEPLYMLFRAVKHQVDRGPVDALTGDAKYSLSEEKLIRQHTDYRVITLEVIDLDNQYSQQTFSVKVLTCDTISQVKDKILDTIYRYVPFSLRPDGSELDIEWQSSPKSRIILQDEDSTTKSEGSFRRLNTLVHYRVVDGATVSLVPRQRSLYSIDSSNNKSFSHKYDTLFASSLPLSRSLSSPHAFNEMSTQDTARQYHLVKSHDSEYHKKGENNSKMVSEVYLTRLLATKGTLQQFVDNFFEVLFSTINRSSTLPVAIKYMFDFLDDQALLHGIIDPQVVHTWKSNSLPLRFWVNIIKNPDFFLDVQKSNAVDSCLSVIAQTFMDSCSSSELRLGKDSPSSKLLYAKDIPKYKKWVERYYQDIQQMPSISEQDMNSTLCEESMLHQNDFNVTPALFELYKYAVKYNHDLMQSLEEDEFARNYRLSVRLSQVHAAMEGIA